MTRTELQQFFSLYQEHRYKNQVNWYTSTRTEFDKAHNQALWLNIGLLGITSLASFLSTISSFPSWLKLTCLLLAAICPVISTGIAAYNTLYGFEQQEKLYKDTIKNLI